MRPRDRVKRHIKTTKMLHCAPVHNASADGEVAWVKVVFVHGALVFDGAWWWHRMSEPLAGLGLGTRALEIPSCVAPPVVPSESMGDMHADADTVRAALDEEDEQVVLVGHSYGGMVITDAAAGHGKVEHLVYITSVMPELGETLAGFGVGREPGPWMDPNPEEGTMGLKAELAPEAFLQDCDGEAVAGALRRLTRQPLAAFGQSPRAVAWREKPSTYVVCAEDRATPAQAQRAFAKRADRVVELPTGHHPMLSRPEQLARVLAEAARPAKYR
jgi:pimeloyl-ACP methyl ester carboxylesterase